MVGSDSVFSLSAPPSCCIAEHTRPSSLCCSSTGRAAAACAARPSCWWRTAPPKCTTTSLKSTTGLKGRFVSLCLSWCTVALIVEFGRTLFCTLWTGITNIVNILQIMGNFKIFGSSPSALCYEFVQLTGYCHFRRQQDDNEAKYLLKI